MTKVMATIIPFTDEQARAAINLEQHYDTWMAAERELRQLPYGLRWAERSGSFYLYRSLDRHGNAKSLGPKSPETEKIYADYVSQKSALNDRIQQSKERLNDTTRIYRSLRMPMIAPEAAKILREADIRGLLGSSLLVVGTNAMPAYSLEAGGRIQTPDETDDFDMTWSDRSSPSNEPVVISMLKAVDSTYTMNTERTFQARNAKAHEFELLAAPSTIGSLSPRDQPQPIPLPEQEWLLLGKPVSRVVTARDGSPARIVAPDPRFFALQKLWLSEKPERDALKKPKDYKQGNALLSTVAEHMPHYPVDDEFQNSLPSELTPYFERWLQVHPITRPSTNW